MTAQVTLGDLEPSDVEVQLVYGAVDLDDELIDPIIVSMSKDGDGDVPGWHRYGREIEFDRAGNFGFTVRVVPSHPDLPTTRTSAGWRGHRVSRATLTNGAPRAATAPVPSRLPAATTRDRVIAAARLRTPRLVATPGRCCGTTRSAGRARRAGEAAVAGVAVEEPLEPRHHQLADGVVRRRRAEVAAADRQLGLLAGEAGRRRRSSSSELPAMASFEHDSEEGRLVVGVPLTRVPRGHGQDDLDVGIRSGGAAASRRRPSTSHRRRGGWDRCGWPRGSTSSGTGRRPAAGWTATRASRPASWCRWSGPRSRARRGAGPYQAIDDSADMNPGTMTDGAEAAEAGVGRVVDGAAAEAADRRAHRAELMANGPRLAVRHLLGRVGPLDVAARLAGVDGRGRATRPVSSWSSRPRPRIAAAEQAPAGHRQHRRPGEQTRADVFTWFPPLLSPKVPTHAGPR